MTRKKSIPPVFTRFAEKIKICPLRGCWLWQGGKNYQGYGRFQINTTEIMAHRFAYMCLVGEIPEGKEIDHFLVSQGKCSQDCVNPDHLKAVTRRENVNNRRISYAVTGKCKYGHPMDAANVYVDAGTGFKHCRTCMPIFRRNYYVAHREKILARQKERVAARSLARRQSRTKNDALTADVCGSVDIGYEGADIINPVTEQREYEQAKLASLFA